MFLAFLFSSKSKMYLNRMHYRRIFNAVLISFKERYLMNSEARKCTSFYFEKTFYSFFFNLRISSIKTGTIKKISYKTCETKTYCLTKAYFASFWYNVPTRFQLKLRMMDNRGGLNSLSEGTTRKKWGKLLSVNIGWVSA